MYYPQTIPEPYSVYPIPNGFCICGPHAQTAEENKEKGTVSSVYIIIQDKFACVVDTGRFNACYEKIAHILVDQKLTLKYIILTHDHYDHVGNAERLRHEFGGEIIAHVLDAPLIRNPLIIYDATLMRQHYGVALHEAWNDIGVTGEAIINMQQGMAKYFTVPVNVDRYIITDEILYLKELPIHLLHTPGHSPGSISVHIPSSATIFTGDLTFWVNPCRPYPIGNAKDCINSLKKIRDLAPTYCGHGHYNGVDNPAAWLDTLIEKHHKLRNDILSLLVQPQTIAQLRMVLFPYDPFDSFTPIPENSIQAILIDLMQNNEISRQVTLQGIIWQNMNRAS